MTDSILIEDLKAEVFLGVYDWEQAQPQTVLLSLEFPCDAAQSAAQDRLIDAIDYDQITNTCIQWLSTQKIALIETLAERLAQHLMTHFPINWLKLSLKKPKAIPAARLVSILIERKNNKTS